MNQNVENKIKAKFYALFDEKIETEIIDAVLTASNYNGKYKKEDWLLVSYLSHINLYKNWA